MICYFYFLIISNKLSKVIHDKPYFKSFYYKYFILLFDLEQTESLDKLRNNRVSELTEIRLNEMPFSLSY